MGQESLPYIEAWLDTLEGQGRSQHTLNAYRRALQHLATWSQTTYGETLDPTRLIARDMHDWKSYQQRVEKAAPSTINQRLAAASSFYKWATATHLVAHNPVADIRSITLAPRQPQSLSYKALRRLLREVHRGKELRDIALVELLTGTGLRVGELLALECSDLELRERSGWLTVREGKHGGYREVPLTKVVRRALGAYLETHPYNQSGHPAYQEERCPLWWGKRGPLTHRSAISRLLEKYAMRAGIEQISPHTLRHTFATLYLRANPGDFRGLAALLGHSDLNTVMIYTEPTLSDLMQRLERVATLPPPP